MRRLRHAVSRPCDAFRAVLEPLLSCASYAADGAAATHPVLRRAYRRRVEPTAPSMRRLGPPAGCGGCSVGGKPGRCLRVRHRCPCAFSRGRSTGLGVAGFAIRSRRDRHRPRASPRCPNGPIRARLTPPGSPALRRGLSIGVPRVGPRKSCGEWRGLSQSNHSPITVSQLFRNKNFTVPPRAHPSAGSPSGSAAPGLTQVQYRVLHGRPGGARGPRNSEVIPFLLNFISQVRSFSPSVQGGPCLFFGG